jgi:hypothetical protein
MAEIAASIERIYPSEVSADDYVFAADTVPPRFATVVQDAHGYWTASGPYTKDRLDGELSRWNDGGAGAPFTAEEQKMYDLNPGYEANMEDTFTTDDYPGGRDRAALNLARFVLGA